MRFPHEGGRAPIAHPEDVPGVRSRFAPRRLGWLRPLPRSVGRIDGGFSLRNGFCCLFKSRVFTHLRAQCLAFALKFRPARSNWHADVQVRRAGSARHLTGLCSGDGLRSSASSDRVPAMLRRFLPLRRGLLHVAPIRLRAPLRSR